MKTKENITAPQQSKVTPGISFARSPRRALPFNNPIIHQSNNPSSGDLRRSRTSATHDQDPCSVSKAGLRSDSLTIPDSSLAPVPPSGMPTTSSSSSSSSSTPDRTQPSAPPNQNSTPLMLHLFTDPVVLEQIGSARLAKFLNNFVDDSPPASLPQLTEEPSSPDYFNAIAAWFTDTTAPPPSLLAAMSALETATSPENTDRLNALIQHHIPNVSINRGCPLDCALELWFTSPQILSEFQSSSSSSSPRTSSSSSIAESPSDAASTVQNSAVQGSTVQSSELQRLRLLKSKIKIQKSKIPPTPPTPTTSSIPIPFSHWRTSNHGPRR